MLPCNGAGYKSRYGEEAVYVRNVQYKNDVPNRMRQAHFNSYFLVMLELIGFLNHSPTR